MHLSMVQLLLQSLVESDLCKNDNHIAAASQILRLLQALDEVREAAQCWEQQAQGSLQQLDRLKDILKESASWAGGLPSCPLS